MNYIKENKIDGAYSINEEDKKCMQFFIQEAWKAGNISRYKRKLEDKIELDKQEMDC